VYIFYILIIFMASAYKGHLSLSLFASVRGQCLLLIPSTIPAALTIFTLWTIPIRRALLGAIIGVIVGIAGLALSVWMEIKLLGSFEANPGIVLEALIMLLPTSVSGAYAGLANYKREETTDFAHPAE
jgi:hypothetical protein